MSQPLKYQPFYRILVTRTDRIGDLVLSTPVFKALREKYPHGHIACLTFVENRELVEGNPYLNEVILYDKKGSEKSGWGNIRFARKLAGKKCLGMETIATMIKGNAQEELRMSSWPIKPLKKLSGRFGGKTGPLSTLKIN